MTNNKDPQQIRKNLAPIYAFIDETERKLSLDAQKTYPLSYEKVLDRLDNINFEISRAMHDCESTKRENEKLIRKNNYFRKENEYIRDLLEKTNEDYWPDDDNLFDSN